MALLDRQRVELLVEDVLALVEPLLEILEFRARRLGLALEVLAGLELLALGLQLDLLGLVLRLQLGGGAGRLGVGAGLRYQLLTRRDEVPVNPDRSSDQADQ